jgi:translation initiation factor eIF-2B subunit alpha
MSLESVIEFFKESHMHLQSPSHATIDALTRVLVDSTQSTSQGLLLELQDSIEVLLEGIVPYLENIGRSLISIKSSCNLFRHYSQRTLSESAFLNFEDLKTELIHKGLNLANMRTLSAAKIAELTKRVFKENLVVLVHGKSFLINEALKSAAEHFHTKVLVTECRPFNEGEQTLQLLKELGIKCQLVLDSSIASIMDQVDCCFLGAEAVVESGGIINRIGSYNVAMIAKGFRRPVYVLVESLKFHRSFPLTQRDLPMQTFQVSAEFSTPLCDFTPPSLVTLLFTDLGILTPSAISDELIKLYTG